MKLLTTLALSLTLVGAAQENYIKTNSVSIDDFISYIVDAYPTSEEEQDPRHINFLLQVGKRGFNAEDQVIMKQAFKILSDRLEPDDLITLTVYSKLNGLVLAQENPKDIKTILHAIHTIESTLKETHADGISLAYDYMKEHYSENIEPSVVMVRNSNVFASNYTINSAVDVKTPKKNESNAVVLTAIALLPELISVIKN
ncbi:hypothetical protein RM697_12255 [Ichthyenterobacterium sp. W332]|uniref:Uncharacterized protein n=1 Tax=Microcosmobacter mediterraneus TaxID=3075607 RepID=A0ABU2YMN7_9FLAO|nr:hypothetical protein [Ichthyenterobacterium sp. W332]MDT0559428.1 hypothetical protein [Ichthyenterobacterium sp. W332]